MPQMPICSSPISTAVDVAMLGRTTPSRLVLSSGAKVGDYVYMNDVLETGKDSSSLLVLDAATLAELARAEAPGPGRAGVLVRAPVPLEQLRHRLQQMAFLNRGLSITLIDEREDAGENEASTADADDEYDARNRI